MKRLYNWINDLNQFFWERMIFSTAVDSKSLSALRVLTGLLLLAVFGPTFSWIGQVPKAFFNPPLLSAAALFDGFPGGWLFQMLDAVALLSLVCLTVGIRAGVATVVYLLSCIIGLHFQYSFGKIDHSIMMYFFLGCMSFSGWGSHLAVVPDKPVEKGTTIKSLSLLGVVLCFAMFTAGFEKAINWVDFDLSVNGFLDWSQSGIYATYRHYLLAPYVKHLPPLILELIDYCAVAFELTPLLFLLHSRKNWRFWLLIACMFHMANTLLLNIPFTAQAIIYLAFIEFNWLYQKLCYQYRKPSFRYAAVGVVAVLVVIRVARTYFGVSLVTFLTPEVVTQLGLYFGLVIWGIAILLIMRSFMKSYTIADQKNIQRYISKENRSSIRRTYVKF